MLEYSILEAGAVADGKTKNTDAIQQAIDACSKAGGGRVVCPPGEFLTGTLELKSRVELYLSPGCRIVGSPDRADYTDMKADGFIAENAPERSINSLIMARNAEDVAVTGPGEINGSGLAFYDPKPGEEKLDKPAGTRPRIVMFYNCRNVRFEDASFVDSSNWTFWLMKCENVKVRGITIRGNRRMRNNDGIDIDACRDVVISDSVIDTEDDSLILRAIQYVFEEPAVCENVTVSNCVLKSCCQGIRVGCPTDGVIRNCTFSNIVIDSTGNGIVSNHPEIYVGPGQSGITDIHDIHFSNITIHCRRNPVKIDLEENIELKRISGLRFSNITAKSPAPCLILGSRKTPVEDVSFSNVTLSTTGQDSVILRNCRGVKMNHMEISNEGS